MPEHIPPTAPDEELMYSPLPPASNLRHYGKLFLQFLGRFLLMTILLGIFVAIFILFMRLAVRIPTPESAWEEAPHSFPIFYD